MSRNRRPSVAKTFLILLSYFAAAVAIIMSMSLVSQDRPGEAIPGAALGLFLILAARKGSR